MARPATLADRFIAKRFTADGPHFVQAAVAAELQAKCRAAEKFVFDESGAAQIGEMAKTMPELLVREAPMAYPPYDLTWIEFPHWRYWQAVASPEEIAQNNEQKWGTADHSLGYLIDHGVVTVIPGGTIGDPLREPEIFPIQYHLQTPWTEAGAVEFCQMARISRDLLDAYLWGSTLPHIPEGALGTVRQTNRLSILPLKPHSVSWLDKHKRNLMVGCAGELRTILAFLVMLARPAVQRREAQPRDRKFVRGKLLPLFGHTTVRIDLDAVAYIRRETKPANGTGTPKRHHHVEGFFRHDQWFHDATELGCEHAMQPTHRDWSPWPDAPLGTEVRKWWMCAKCGGKAVRVKPHWRGKLAQGLISHDHYKVT
jgi:hypothetical protein